jgi:hypothetical protein
MVSAMISTHRGTLRPENPTKRVTAIGSKMTKYASGYLDDHQSTASRSVTLPNPPDERANCVQDGPVHGIARNRQLPGIIGRHKPEPPAGAAVVEVATDAQKDSTI